MTVTNPARQSRTGLIEEGVYLRRSLADLDLELAAGDLDPADHEELRRRYLARAEEIAAVLAELGEVEAEARAETDSGNRAERRSAGRWLADGRNRLVLGWSAAACFVMAGALVGLGLAGVAPFGRSPAPTLTVAAQIQTELAEASVLATNHEIVQAVAVYGKVLDLDPTQPEALADGGWLIRLAGLSSHKQSLVVSGDREIAAAVRVAPGYALARAYDGVALFQDSRSAGAAVGEFAAMLAAHPSATLVRSVGSVALEAYKAAGRKIPPTLAAAGG